MRGGAGFIAVYWGCCSPESQSQHERSTDRREWQPKRTPHCATSRPWRESVRKCTPRSVSNATTGLHRLCGYGRGHQQRRWHSSSTPAPSCSCWWPGNERRCHDWRRSSALPLSNARVRAIEATLLGSTRACAKTHISTWTTSLYLAML